MSRLRVIAMLVLVVAAVYAVGLVSNPASSDELQFDALCEEGHFDKAQALVEEALVREPQRQGLHERRLLFALRSMSPEAPSVAAHLWRKMDTAGVKSDVLSQALRHMQPSIRRNAAQTIELVRYQPAREALESCVQDGNPDVRTAVVAALEALCNKESFFALALALRDSDWRVRAEAASALGRLGESKAVAHLVRLTKDPDPYVRVQASESLLALAEPGSALFLAKALQRVEGTQAESPVALALAKAGDPAGYQRVELLLKTQEPGQRREIARSLTEIDAEAASKLFHGMIDAESDPEMKQIMLDCVADHPATGE